MNTVYVNYTLNYSEVWCFTKKISPYQTITTFTFRLNNAFHYDIPKLQTATANILNVLVTLDSHLTKREKYFVQRRSDYAQSLNETWARSTGRMILNGQNRHAGDKSQCLFVHHKSHTVRDRHTGFSGERLANNSDDHGTTLAVGSVGYEKEYASKMSGTYFLKPPKNSSLLILKKEKKCSRMLGCNNYQCLLFSLVTLRHRTR
jgi:hypothetical protein